MRSKKKNKNGERAALSPFLFFFLRFAAVPIPFTNSGQKSIQTR